MPIPKETLLQLQAVAILMDTESGAVTLYREGIYGDIPASLGSGGWIVCPGLFTQEESIEHQLRDLDHRLHQARLGSQAIRVVSNGASFDGRLVRGMTRSKAVALGYKLRHWAIFELRMERFSIVYTGHNSRAR